MISWWSSVCPEDTNNANSTFQHQQKWIGFWMRAATPKDLPTMMMKRRREQWSTRVALPLLLLVGNFGGANVVTSAWILPAVHNVHVARTRSQPRTTTPTTTTITTKTTPSSFVVMSAAAAADSSSSSSSSSTTTSTPSSTLSFPLPHLELSQIDDLARNGYVVIPNFINESFQAALRDDVHQLRSSSTNSYFRQAKIGQDATNTLNQNIRVAETCFFSQLQQQSSQQSQNAARTQLLRLLQQIPQDLLQHADVLTDDNSVTRNIPTRQLDVATTHSWLHEWLYAYYPQGGFYRRHVDAVSGSASTLRCYSLLLYLNDNQIWKKEQGNDEKNGGQLRLHFDSGRDELPEGERPNYVDVPPYGGTLVLFGSREIPHEVLDTNLERLVVVGWYNRMVRPSDVWELTPGNNNNNEAQPQRLGMLAVSATLILVGLYQLLGAS